MDYLAVFNSTRSVMQAEQLLIRIQIPFETVPHKQYDRSKCGLAILFSEDYLSKFEQMMVQNDLNFDLIKVK